MNQEEDIMLLDGSPILPQQTIELNSENINAKYKEADKENIRFS